MKHILGTIVVLSLSACKTSQLKQETSKSSPAAIASSDETDKLPTRVVADFRALCSSGDTDEARRHTIEKMLQAAEVQDCNKAWEKLKQMTVLDLSSADLTDISPLSQLDQLTELTLSFNHIEDLRPLMGMKQLSELFLGDNDVRDVAPLQVLTKLKTLDLGNNQIETVDSIRNLALLEWLDLSQNELKTISPLEKLQKIWFLSLANNKLADIDVLRQHQMLEELYLQGNLISDLSALKTAKQLLGLDASMNPLGQSVRKNSENCPMSQQAGSALKEFCAQR